jgi:hypothetical protein
LFLFGVGYSVGPLFLWSLKKSALPQIILAVVVAVTGLTSVISVVKLFGFNEGIAVGLLSGGMTQSAALGTGLSAISELPIADAEKSKLMADAPLGDAITYGFGDLGLILFLTWLGPKISAGRPAAGRERCSSNSSRAAGRAAMVFTAVRYGLRAYRLDNPETCVVGRLARSSSDSPPNVWPYRRVQARRRRYMAPESGAWRSGRAIGWSSPLAEARSSTPQRPSGPRIDDPTLLAVARCRPHPWS